MDHAQESYREVRENNLGLKYWFLIGAMSVICTHMELRQDTDKDISPQRQ